MKFLSNIYDPNRLDAPSHIALMINETREEAWANQVQWLKDKIIGEPKGTEYHTVEQLKAMGMVGVYKR